MIRAGGEVARLIADLRGQDRVARDAAVARLRVVGPRALNALVEVAQGNDSPDIRAAALKALEGVDDPRVVDVAIPLLNTPVPLAGAAISVLQPWVTHEPGTRVLEALTGLAIDPTRDAALRLAALDALSQLPRDLVAPVLERAALGEPTVPADDDPLTLQEWLGENGSAPLSAIHSLIASVREHEQRERTPSRRALWMRTRGAAHAALAARGSRVALYDLREAFDAATGPLPLDYLTAVATIGDASCLEPLARAWAASGDSRWRTRLAEAGSEILHRSRLSGRTAIVKRVRARWPGFL